jgi:hypothetical protein
MSTILGDSLPLTIKRNNVSPEKWMVPIMPWCTLGDPLQYIPGSYHKTTTFVIENNVSPFVVVCFCFFVLRISRAPLSYMKTWHNLQQRSLYCLQRLTTVHTVRQCTCIWEADPHISIRRAPFYYRKKNLISKPFFFKGNIRENYKTWLKKNDKEIFC